MIILDLFSKTFQPVLCSLSVVRTRVRKPNKMQAGGVRRGPGVVRSLTMPNDARKAAAERHYAQQVGYEYHCVTS